MRPVELPRRIDLVRDHCCLQLLLAIDRYSDESIRAMITVALLKACYVDPWKWMISTFLNGVNC